MRFIPYTLFGTALLLTPVGRAGAQTSVAADSLAAAGDTIGALMAFDAILRRHPDDADAHYRLGRLHRALFLGTPDTTLSLRRRRNWDRNRAERHFRRATEIAPDSAQYWLAWAELLRTKTSMVSRFRVMDLVDSSVAAARRGARGLVVADVGYRAARVEWERYEQMGHRYLFSGDITGIDDSLFYADWRYAQRVFQVYTRPDPGHPGDRQKRKAEEYLRWALDANPRHVRAAGLLAVVLGDDARRAEAHELARRIVRAAPDSGKSWAVLGLALARMNRWQEAQAAFDTAFTRMTPQEREPYDNLTLILRAADRPQYSERQPAQQEELRRLYWAAGQPLFLRNVNEPETEYFARITYVYHRWSDDLEGHAGYDTDRGRVYVRWGPPDIWAVLGRDRLTREESPDVLTAWVYNRPRLRFLFGGVPGFTRTRLAGFERGRAVYQENQHNHPVRFDNVPTVAEMDTIHVQLAQFRPDDTTATDVLAYSFAPLGRLANVDIDRVPVTTGIIVKDGSLHDVVREVREHMATAGDTTQLDTRTWRLALAPGEYLVRVEAELPTIQRAARSSGMLSVRDFTGDTLLLSDILVARRLEARDSTFRRWSDFLIVPSAARFAPGDPVAFLWEMYNLQPDSSGVAHYTVRLAVRVDAIERHGVFAQVLGGIGDATGLSALGDDRVVLEYDNDVAIDPGAAQAEYLVLDLRSDQQVTYEIELTVVDRSTGQAATVSRRFEVTSTPLRRGPR